MSSWSEIDESKSHYSSTKIPTDSIDGSHQKLQCPGPLVGITMSSSLPYSRNGLNTENNKQEKSLV